MRKKKIFITLALVLSMAVPFSVFAATSNAPVAKTIRGFFKIDTSKLTDQQKADVKDYSQKMADLQKDFINKMVANGALTKEQGDAEVQKIDDMLKNGGINGFLPGFGKGRGGFDGHGRGNEFGFGKMDTSKLTDQQKTDLMDTYKKMADLQKETINKMVSSGLMTKEQGDTATQKIDEMLKNVQDNGFSKGLGMFMGGFGRLGMHGIEPSKLTDQQKADLTDFLSKMSDLQKELVNKMVSYGSMTQEQGNAAITRIDNMLKNIKENGFPGGKGMEKGRPGSRQKHENPNGSTTAAPAV